MTNDQHTTVREIEKSCQADSGILFPASRDDLRYNIFVPPARERRPMTFKPNLALLMPPQLQLWPELDATPQHFTLYGGTALALRLGRRTSVHFDFFPTSPLTPMSWPLLSLTSKEPNGFRSPRIP